MIYNGTWEDFNKMEEEIEEEDFEQTFEVELTADEIKSIMDMFSENIFRIIREDEDVDNINWLCMMTDIYKKLKCAINGDDRPSTVSPWAYLSEELDG